MKSKFGTALALAAVLLTGTAAAAINTQALIGPATSTLGTAATTLLPANQAAVVTPVQTPSTTSSPTQSQSAVTTAPNQTASPAATVATSASSPTATSMTSAPKNPSVVYGNPNPTNGEDDDDDDDEGQDNDGDDD